MSSFLGKYSSWYDEIYRDKDYEGETSFLFEIFTHLTGKSQPKAVLDLGCGTGRHLELIPSGSERIGVDQSEAMIQIARRRLPEDVELIVADIGTVRLGSKFDLIYSMFHVVNYHVSDLMLSAFFKTIAANLSPNGIAFFDSWNQDAWRSSPPHDSVRFVGPGPDLIRLVQSQVDTRSASVQLQISTLDREDTGLYRLGESEIHRMRAYSIQELERHAASHRLRVIASGSELKRDSRVTPEMWTFWVALSRENSSSGLTR